MLHAASRRWHAAAASACTSQCVVRFGKATHPRIPSGVRGLLLLHLASKTTACYFGTSATCGCRAAESVLAFASLALSCKAVALARFSATNAASTVAACARR